MPGKVVRSALFEEDGTTPLATGGGGSHAASHQNNGADEISVAGLSGVLADAQTPATHSHAQADITNLVTDLGAKQATSEKAQANGYASLGADGKVPAAQLPAGSDGEVALYKASDQQISAAGWVNISGLTFAVAASKAYLIEAYIVFQSSATTMGVLIGVSGPASPALVSIRGRKEITAVATAGTDKFSEAVLSAYDTANPASLAEIALNTNLAHEFRGVFVNGVNAGTFALRLNKENVAGTGTIKAGSWLRYRLLN